MKSSKQGKEKYKIYSLRRKGTPENVVVDSSLVLKEMRSFKKSLRLDQMQEDGTGQNPRSYSCETKGLRDFLGLNNRKLTEM